MPWRAHEAEAALKGKRLDEDVAMKAADAAFADAETYGHNAFKGSAHDLSKTAR